MALVARVVDFTVGGMAFIEGSELEMVFTLNRAATPPVLEEMKTRVLGGGLSEERSGALTDHARPGARASLRRGDQRAHRHRARGLRRLPDRDQPASLRPHGPRRAGGGAHAAETAGFLGQVANQAHIVMENSRLFERVRNLAIRDSLTGLFNHRHTMDLLAQEFDRSGRYELGMSVLMLDIDHFKKVNDEHGHLAGDAVLREVARLLKDTLRTVDSVGRYGGEEFLVLLPQTPPDEARRTGERIRQQIAQHAFRAGRRELRVTVSVGVATWESGGAQSAEGLIREADQALYRAKEQGRNRVAGGG